MPDPSPASMTPVGIYPHGNGSFRAACGIDACRWIGGAPTFAMAALEAELHDCGPAQSAPGVQP